MGAGSSSRARFLSGDLAIGPHHELIPMPKGTIAEQILDEDRPGKSFLAFTPSKLHVLLARKEAVELYAEFSAELARSACPEKPRPRAQYSHAWVSPVAAKEPDELPSPSAIGWESDRIHAIVSEYAPLFHEKGIGLSYNLASWHDGPSRGSRVLAASPDASGQAAEVARRVLWRRWLEFVDLAVAAATATSSQGTYTFRPGRNYEHHPLDYLPIKPSKPVKLRPPRTARSHSMWGAKFPIRRRSRREAADKYRAQEETKEERRPEASEEEEEAYDDEVAAAPGEAGVIDEEVSGCSSTTSVGTAKVLVPASEGELRGSFLDAESRRGAQQQQEEEKETLQTASEVVIPLRLSLRLGYELQLALRSAAIERPDGVAGGMLAPPLDSASRTGLDVAWGSVEKASVVDEKGDEWPSHDSNDVDTATGDDEVGEATEPSTMPVGLLVVQKFVHALLHNAVKLHEAVDHPSITEPASSTTSGSTADAGPVASSPRSIRMQATLDGLEKLGEQGKYAEAEPLFRQALEVSEAECGLNHPDTLESVMCLAVLVCDLGRYGEAEELYRRALEGRIVALGGAHPDTKGSLDGLAQVLRLQGKEDEAIDLLREREYDL